MIEFSGASLRRGAKLLFEDATFQIHAGWRVGLTGRNGTGKSSLLAALRGTLATDCGDIRIAGNPSIAWVDQETPALPLSALLVLAIWIWRMYLIRNLQLAAAREAGAT